MAGKGSAPGEHRGGRKKGVPNKVTIARQEAIAASGMTPLDFMMSVMRSDAFEPAERLDAAKAAAPYVHPKLANVELTGKDKGPLEVRIVRFSDAAQQMAASVVPAASVGSTGTGLPPSRPMLASPGGQGRPVPSLHGNAGDSVPS